jgi:EAL domain-containing protein (putative c-di-GMP-specific phosphodiesterase class I)
MQTITELSELIQDENLTIHFQPIVSLKQNAVVGLEALARPGSVHGQPPMNVVEMFRRAQTEGRLLELDRLCRRKALSLFHGLAQLKPPKPLLFVNIEASVIDQGVVGSGSIAQAVQAAGLRPEDVVLEINESKVTDTAALRRFVDHHREQDFLIALDDLGAGESNLPRVATLRPHILKLDRSLVQAIDADYFKQETFKSLVSLGHRIGCIILAEGVETQAEVDTCAALGAELFQGFHFSRAIAPEKLDFEILAPAVQSAARRLRETAVEAIHQRRSQAQKMRRLSDAVRGSLTFSEADSFDAVLARLVQTESEVECAYMLDREGVQITDTHMPPEASGPLNRLFAAAPKGSDHSHKVYFYSLIDGGLERYTTEMYLSRGSGHYCRTVASLVHRRDGAKLVLCLDLRADS